MKQAMFQILNQPKSTTEILISRTKFNLTHILTNPYENKIS